ncbi:MAG TPA: endo-1,4-beta-xylanase [Verrucomicrobiae bacterium]|nr:endo-1,4-beta-xylanase [Verrucomicrobiae bacterium]
MDIIPRAPSPRACTRREFLATAGAASAALAFPHASRAEPEALLAGAADRIEKHRKGSASLRLTGPDGNPIPAGTTIKIEQARHRFLFGCNIFKLDRCRTPEDNARYVERFASLLNFATLPFYWWAYEVRRGEPADAATTRCADWCHSHGITTKGHPLAWNWVDPPWLQDVPQGDVMRLQMERIGQCVSKFKGSIDIWDVVNEATHYDRAEPKQKAPRLTEAIRQSGVGEYLRGAFREARAANPAATLLINDYRVDPEYQTRVLAELNDERLRPLYDVIGIQSHMHGGPWPTAKTWEVCEQFAKYGRPIHFTETTLVSGPKTPAGWRTTAEGEEKQAARVREFYTLLFSHPAVNAITWWDLTDQGAWQAAPAGLIRDDMSPKPAYDALLELIKGKWWTRAETKAQANGLANLDGFFGDYAITADVGGRRLTGGFTHARAGRTHDVRLA